MWITESSHRCCCCHVMSDEIEQRKALFSGSLEVISEPSCKMTCVGSVRLNVGVCGSACDAGTSPVFILRKTNDRAVLKLSIGKVV